MPTQVNFYYRDTGALADWLTLDRAICQHLDIPADDEEWVFGWYDSIGFRLALGQTMEQIADQYQAAIAEGRLWGYNLLRVCHYLNEHFTTDAYRVWK